MWQLGLTQRVERNLFENAGLLVLAKQGEIEGGGDGL